LIPSYFSQLRHKYFPKVKSPKYTRQGKCDICLDLTEKKLNCQDPIERISIHQKFVKHNNNQIKERFHYKARVVKAQLQPNEYLSIILDEMNALHFSLKMSMTKNTTRIERLKLHVHGLINHENNVKRMYGSLDHWKYGFNFVALVLMDYLQELHKKGGQ
jgi:hypothetical protein